MHVRVFVCSFIYVVTLTRPYALVTDPTVRQRSKIITIYLNLIKLKALSRPDALLLFGAFAGGCTDERVRVRVSGRGRRPCRQGLIFGVCWRTRKLSDASVFPAEQDAERGLLIMELPNQVEREDEHQTTLRVLLLVGWLAFCCERMDALGGLIASGRDKLDIKNQTTPPLRLGRAFLYIPFRPFPAGKGHKNQSKLRLLMVGERGD